MSEFIPRREGPLSATNRQALHSPIPLPVAGFMRLLFSGARARRLHPLDHQETRS